MTFFKRRFQRNILSSAVVLAAGLGATAAGAQELNVWFDTISTGQPSGALAIPHESFDWSVTDYIEVRADDGDTLYNDDFFSSTKFYTRPQDASDTVALISYEVSLNNFIGTIRNVDGGIEFSSASDSVAIGWTGLTEAVDHHGEYIKSDSSNYGGDVVITGQNAVELYDGDVTANGIASIDFAGASGSVVAAQQYWGYSADAASGVISVDTTGAGISTSADSNVRYVMDATASFSTRDQYLFSGNSTVLVPAGATLEAVLNDGHAADKAFYKAKQFDIADGATIRVDGSSADYTKPSDETRYVIVEADTLNADIDALNLTATGLNDVSFDSSDNQIAITVTAQDLAVLAGGLGDGANSVAAAAGLQSALTQRGGTAMGDKLYDLAVSLRDGGSFEQLAPMVENTSGASIRGADGQAAGRVGGVLQSYRGGAAGGSSGDAPVASGFWVQGLSSSGEQDSMGAANGFDIDTTGYAFGYDAEFVKGLTTGIAVSYADSEVDVDNSFDSQDSDGYTAALYGQYLFGNNYYGSTILSYGQNDNDSHRWVSNDYADASFDSDILSLRLESGKDIWFDSLLVQPMVAFNYSDIGVDGYTETGSVAALDVDSQDYKIVELGFGVNVSQDFAVAGTVLRPELRAAYYHDFQQDGVQVTSRFTAGGSSFVTTGEDADANRYNLNAGLAWVLGDNNTLRASYDFNSSDHYTGGAWLVDYRMDF